MADADRLDSWKEIASYLRRGLRTAQRWERDAGLPVRRVAGNSGAVYAFEPSSTRGGSAGRSMATGRPRRPSPPPMGEGPSAPIRRCAPLAARPPLPVA